MIRWLHGCSINKELGTKRNEAKGKKGKKKTCAFEPSGHALSGWGQAVEESERMAEPEIERRVRGINPNLRSTGGLPQQSDPEKAEMPSISSC